MTDDQLLRYSRHILLDELGVQGQQRLLAAHALVIGAGGLGSPVALYLGSAGVGRITLVDHDRVDATNLQRQLAHTLARVGQPKAQSAQAAIAAINPDVQVHALVQRADDALLNQLVPQADVVLDCTDNFATRHAVNRACVRHQKPLVWGAAIRFDGQISVYNPQPPHQQSHPHAAAPAPSPCYACIFPPSAPLEETRCATLGVFAPLVGIIGSIQAAEAIKLLTGTGTGTPLSGRLLMLDARCMQTTTIALAAHPQCEVCGRKNAA